MRLGPRGRRGGRGRREGGRGAGSQGGRGEGDRRQGGRGAGLEGDLWGGRLGEGLSGEERLEGREEGLLSQTLSLVVLLEVGHWEGRLVEVGRVLCRDCLRWEGVRLWAGVLLEGGLWVGLQMVLLKVEGL